MAEWRYEGTACPLNGGSLSWGGTCSPDPEHICRYLRGGSSQTGQRSKVLCNWPRNGSDIDTGPDMSQTDVLGWLRGQFDAVQE